MGNRTRVVVVVLALVATATAALSAAAHATPRADDLRLDAVVTFGTGWCCGTSTDFAGSAVIPEIGTVRYSGNRLDGCNFFPGAVEYPCFLRLDLAFVGRDGSTFTLVADDEWTFPLEQKPATLAWAIDTTSTTGRFARLTGGGTYTFETDGTTATVVLSGSMQRLHSAH